MNDSQDPPTTIENDPLDILSNLRHAHDFSTDGNSSTAFIHDLALNAENSAISKLQNEKLELGKNGTQYLFSVLKEASSSLQADSNSLTEEERAACLQITNSTVAKRREDFKSDLLNLVTELAEIMNERCGQEDPMLVLNEAVPELIERETAGGGEGLEFSEHFWELPGIVERDFKAEKLDASKETACFLKSALGYLDEEEDRREIARLFESASRSTDCRRRHMSPLYIGRGTQYVCDSPDFQSDPNTADLNQDTENVPVEESSADEPQEAATQSKYFSSQTTPNTDKVGKRRIDTDHQPAIESDARVEVETSEAVPEKTVLDIQHSTGLPTDQKIISDSPEPRHQLSLDIDTFKIPPSLGTLSSFMQTRGHKNKRRRVQVTSSYFDSAPAIKLDTEKETTTERNFPEQPDLQKLSADDPHQYPRFPPRESKTPLLLILSTSLLHTHRTLINSLESLSSPVSRLIYRDYSARNNANISEEADIIPSTKTGIILTTSQQTTQTHLPGHGSPWLSSPLKERVVRVAPRYELLYVLVQVPSSLDIKTLSSIRELGAFCLSLRQICTIQTLLVPLDHTLEWILAIATKHTESKATSDEDAIQGKTLWPSYLEEQTQWELFLRRAGLNPFAAQSVLDILRNSTLASHNGTNTTCPVRELSRFIELSRETRRDLFQDAVGQSVLRRVENVVEMDWQVEWAVDLS